MIADQLQYFKLFSFQMHKLNDHLYKTLLLYIYINTYVRTPRFSIVSDILIISVYLFILATTNLYYF